MHHFSLARVAALSLSVAFHFVSTACYSGDRVQADVVLHNGILVDGTGAGRRTGDVAIANAKIVAVGTFEVKGTPLVLDCTGLIVAPGFIDLHNHSDEQILKPDTRSNLSSLMQGCTTVVTGNCGAGPIDVAEYYQKLDVQGCGTNVAHLIPQGALRQRVVGLANRPATADELKAMEDLARKAMHEGAWGMSTGLIYVPGSYANKDELVAIATVVGELGGIYASHMRSEGAELLAAVEELLDIGRRGKLPAHVSHFKSSGQESWGLVRQASRLIEEARKEGLKVTADQYPYVASSTSLAATLLPASARAGGREEFLLRLESEEQGPSIRAHVEDSLRTKDDGALIRVARYGSRPEWVGKNIKQIADEENISPVDLCLQIFKTGEMQIVHFCMSEEDVRFVMTLPWVATASDGRAEIPSGERPHPRYYGTFARKVGYYSLREGVLPLEQAVRSCSGLPAEIMGMTDRGVLKPGCFADVVVFDPTTYMDAATYDDPHQYADGVRHVLVNGTLVVHKGHPTGALAGRVLRHETPKREPEPGK